MGHMLERIKSQIDSPNYLIAGSNYLGLKRELWPKINGDLYPLSTDYYHDLNPFFGHNVVNFDFFSTYPVVTLRDGGFTTALFYNINFLKLTKNDQVLLVHKDCEHFVPPQLHSRTLSYKMVQKRRISLKEAKQVILIGVLSDQMIEEKEIIFEKIKLLRDLSPQVKIKIYLQQRKNPYDSVYGEFNNSNSFLFELYHSLKIKPEFMTTSQIFTSGMMKDSYVINLQSDRYLIADSFTDYVLASKGATIHEWDSPSVKETALNHPVSLFHHMEIDFIQRESVFNDLVFIRKRSMASDNFYDSYLFAKFKEYFKKI